MSGVLVRNLALAVALAMAVIGGAAVYAHNSLPQVSSGPVSADRCDVQGVHHRIGRDLGPVDGRDLVIDDVVVGANLVHVCYHATGIQMIAFEQIGDNPLFAREGPNLITAVADGKTLIPFDGNEQSEAGTSSMSGNMVFRWQGGAVHHFQVSIVRIMGDVHATWTTNFDF